MSSTRPRISAAAPPGYENLQGDLANPPVLTADERNTLLSAAWSLNEYMPLVADAPVRGVPLAQYLDGPPSPRPGDDFNARGDVPSVLTRHGWTLAKPGENEYWRRPGKTSGWSATLKDRVFYVFSSNATPFESNQPYSPFSVYTMLEHGGDYARSASALRAQGYGSDLTPPPATAAPLPAAPASSLASLQRRQLEEAGRVRALIYKFMMLTGLRRKETASLTVGSLCLDVDHPYVKVVIKHAKSAKEAALPLRSDLADALREHIASMANDGSGSGSGNGSKNGNGHNNGSDIDNPLPPGYCTTAQVAANTPLFRIDWRNLLRTYNLDLAAAGIVKKDDQGRTVDVHGLRHTFATLLARKGVLPATAQKLMRHSDIRLTMNVYTHLELADTASAVASLPTL